MCRGISCFVRHAGRNAEDIKMENQRIKCRNRNTSEPKTLFEGFWRKMPLDPELKLSQCSAEDLPKVYKFLLENFLADEYLNTAIGYNRPEEIQGFFNSFVQKSVESGLSTKCVDTKTGEIVGCRTSSLLEHDEPDFSKFTWKESAIVGLICKLHEMIPAHLPDAKKILGFDALSVLSSYRRKGIAMAMIEENLRFAKEQGCDHVVLSATNVRSQKLYGKLGFRQLHEMKYEEFEYDGKRPFAGHDDGYGTDSIVLFAKKL